MVLPDPILPAITVKDPADGQVYPGDAPPRVRVPVAQSNRLEQGEPVVPIVSWRRLRLSIVEVEIDRLRQTLRRGATQRPRMSSVATRVCRNRAMKPKHMDVLSDEPHEVDEQGEVSDRQFARLPDAVGRKQQHQASAEVDRVPEEASSPSSRTRSRTMTFWRAWLSRRRWPTTRSSAPASLTA